MIKEALQYIIGLKDANEHRIDSITYTDKPLTPVFKPKAEPLEVSTLTSLIGYIKNSVDGVGDMNVYPKVIVHIESHNKVSVKSQFMDASVERDSFISAIAEAPQFNFNKFYDTEEFIVSMQSKFIESEDKDIILRVVGNLKDGTVRQIGDDGVSQSVTTKTGIATVAAVKVPNPAELRSYRTFIEVEQPLSKFIFRMRDGGSCALFEADGGAWKNTARQDIKVFLESALKEEINEDKIIILA